MRLVNLPALVDFPNYQRVHIAFHKLWSRSVGTPGYVKADWRELEAAIDLLATDGPGRVTR